MRRWSQPEMSPWRRRELTIPPDSRQAWVRLAVWEFWMGAIICGALTLGVNVIVTAPRSVVVVRDLTNCQTASAAADPCEPIAYRIGSLNAAFGVLCGLQLLAVAAWMLWELWSAAQPKPITDEFLKLLDDSFGRDWRHPRTWPWSRLWWAYGLTVPGAVAALLIWMLVSSPLQRTLPATHIETSQSFRLAR